MMSTQLTCARLKGCARFFSLRKRGRTHIEGLARKPLDDGFCTLPFEGGGGQLWRQREAPSNGDCTWDPGLGPGPSKCASLVQAFGGGREWGLGRFGQKARLAAAAPR